MNVIKFKRNEPCQCGSLKKYKNCCFNPNDLTARRIKQMEEYKIKRQKDEEERLKRKAEREKLFPGVNNTNNPAPRRRIGGSFLLMLSLAASLDMRNYNFR